MATHGGRKRFSIQDFLLKFQEPVKGGPADERTAKTAPTEDWKRLKMIAMMHVAASDEDRQRRQRGRSRSR